MSGDEAEINSTGSEEYLEKFENVDYGEDFQTEKKFSSKEELKEWAQATAREQNMFLITQSSRKRNIYLSCERYGKGRIIRKNVDVENKRFTGTKKCQCPFYLIGRQEMEGVWRLDVSNGNHNHPPAVYPHGHAFVSRLSKEQYETTAILSRSHMKPKEILDHLRCEDPSIKTSLRHIYNAKIKMKTEALGGKSVLQHVMQLVQENNYMQWHQTDPDTNQVIDLMFAHPRSIDLLRNFPYVLLIDSTYKTNRYKMPLVQIIGVTPVGMNFTVAVSFMKHESEEHYAWMLRNLRSLFDRDVRPGVIVTDRELGLMKALDAVFPDSHHLLCLFHINKNVQMMATKLLGNNKQIGCVFSRRKWKLIVESATDEAYEINVQTMMWEYQWNPRLMAYLKDTWLVHKEKFVYAWTNNVLHLGSRTTNRVESAHSSLKAWLRSSTGGFDTIWGQIHSQIESQLNGIISELAKSCRITKHVINFAVFRNLGGVVAHWAINLLNKERLRCEQDGIGTDASLCGCYLRSTHGLPCAHEIATMEQMRAAFVSDNIHVFWRTLNIDLASMSTGPVDRCAEVRDRIFGHVDEVLKRPLIYQEEMSDMMFSALYPEACHLEEPAVQQTRGRPKKNPTKRDPSAWEYTFSKFNIGRSSSGSDRTRGRRSSGSRGRSSSSSRGRGRSSSGSVGRHSPGHYCPPQSGSDSAPDKIVDPSEPFKHYLPKVVLADIISSTSIIGDGNCGFRCVAAAVYGDQNQWMRVRRELYDELKDRWSLYERLYGSDDSLGRVMATCAWWTDGPAWDNRYWMSLADLGLVVATRYSAMVLELSAQQCTTNLPLTSADGSGCLSCVIAMAFDASQQHFTLVSLNDNCPLPPFHPQWQRFRDRTVAQFRNAFTLRLRMWVVLSQQM